MDSGDNLREVKWHIGRSCNAKVGNAGGIFCSARIEGTDKNLSPVINQVNREATSRTCVHAVREGVSDSVASVELCTGRVMCGDTQASVQIPRDSHSQSFSFVHKSLKFLHWNVNGLSSKLCDKDFIAYVRSFDFICFVETFLETFQSDLFSDYSIFHKPATKLSKQGRSSGGIVCLIKNTCFSRQCC